MTKIEALEYLLYKSDLRIFAEDGSWQIQVGEGSDSIREIGEDIIIADIDGDYHYISIDHISRISSSRPLDMD